MKATKKVGVWLDHASASVMEYGTDNHKVTTVASDLQGLDNQSGLQHSEDVLHNRENQHLNAYYQDLIAVLKDYDEILLFGPTNAKTELLNLIREEHKYDHLKIATKPADRMTQPEEQAFVVNFFETSLN